MSSPTLSEQDTAILAFAARWWARPGSIVNAIRTELDRTPVRYYQQLNALLDNPAAAAHAPALVARLRRLRTNRWRPR